MKIVKNILITSTLIFLYTSNLYSKEAWVIVHGTFGKISSWYKPGGSFFEALKKEVSKDASVSFFSWSGKSSHKARLEASHEFVCFIENLHKDYSDINVIAHSHGASVVSLASHHFPHVSIRRFFCLGAPILQKLYYPNMERIVRVYNFFSLGDLVQTVMGSYNRIYEKHSHIKNIRLDYGDNNHPTHYKMHSTQIASVLANIEKHIHPADQQSDYKLSISVQKGIQICYDTEQTEALRIDKIFMEQLIATIQQPRNHGKNKSIFDTNSPGALRLGKWRTLYSEWLAKRAHTKNKLLC